MSIRQYAFYYLVCDRCPEVLRDDQGQLVSTVNLIDLPSGLARMPSCPLGWQRTGDSDHLCPACASKQRESASA